MFNKMITRTPLTTHITDGFFSNIHGERYRDDVSFVSTLRALLHERIAGDVVNFYYKRVSHDADTICGASAADLFNAIFRRRKNPDFKGIYLVDASSDHLAIDAYAAKLDNEAYGFVKETPNFRELVDLREFVKPHMNARFYIDEANRCTLVFVANLNMRSYHLLQAIIPRLLPWYFTEKKLTEFDTKLLSSLTKRYATDYEAIIASVMDGIDIREYAIKNIVGRFEVKARTQQLENAKNEASRIRSQIRENMETYRSLIDLLDRAEINIAGLKAITASGEGGSELIDFFLHNKSIFPIRAEGVMLEVIIKTYIDTFDPEMYATMAKNAHSHLYHGYTVGKSEFTNVSDRKLLLDAIFGEASTLKIKGCAYYQLDMRGSAESQRGYNFPDGYNDRLPNPHLHHHNCLGNHRQFMNEALQKGDMVTALSQCMSSARSINIGESVTMERFLRDIFATDEKIIEMPDGSSMPPVEALAWLKSDVKEEA